MGLKEKPKFDKSFIQRSTVKTTKLGAQVNTFLKNLPSEQPKIHKPTLDPTSVEQIESCWKKATTELQSDKKEGVMSPLHREIEVQMALCPFKNIPACLLPGYNGND